MNRRAFLQALGLTAAAASAPALAAKIAATPAGDVLTLEKLKKAVALMTGAPQFFYRTDIDRWMGYAVSENVVNGNVYEFASLFDREPTAKDRKIFVKMAEIGFQRAKRKYG